MDYKMGSVIGQDSFLDSLLFAFDSLNINSFDFANSSYRELISGAYATPGGTILTTGSGLSYAYSSNVGSASGSTYLSWSSTIMPDFTSYTFEAWIKPQFSTTGQKTIWSRYTTTGATRGLIIGISPNGAASNPNTFYINQGTGAATTQQYSNTITWSQNGWQQIAISLSSSDNIAYFYLNGSGVGTRQVTSTLSFIASNIRIGVTANVATFGYDGGIGSVKVWNRKFTDAEILFLYNSSRKRYGL